MSVDKGFHLERLTAVCMALQNLSALKRALRKDYSLTELTALLEDKRAGVRGAAVLALGVVGNYAAAQTLARRLHDEDPTVRPVAEQALWAIWLRSGDKTIDNSIREGARMLQQGRHREAIQTFSSVIEQRPAFPEGYNQRAVAYYLNGDYELSIADCQKVVELNPVHFGALAGMGHCYLHLDEREKALDAYERALQVNPNMSQIQLVVEQLRRELRR